MKGKYYFLVPSNQKVCRQAHADNLGQYRDDDSYRKEYSNNTLKKIINEDFCIKGELRLPFDYV